MREGFVLFLTGVVLPLHAENQTATPVPTFGLGGGLPKSHAHTYNI